MIKIILRAAGKHMGKKKITESYNQELSDARSERGDQKKKYIEEDTVDRQHREDWIDLCQKVNEMIRLEKEKR